MSLTSSNKYLRTLSQLLVCFDYVIRTYFKLSNIMKDVCFLRTCSRTVDRLRPYYVKRHPKRTTNLIPARCGKDPCALNRDLWASMTTFFFQLHALFVFELCRSNHPLLFNATFYSKVEHYFRLNTQP